MHSSGTANSDEGVAHSQLRNSSTVAARGQRVVTMRSQSSFACGYCLELSSNPTLRTQHSTGRLFSAHTRTWRIHAQSPAPKFSDWHPIITNLPAGVASLRAPLFASFLFADGFGEPRCRFSAFCRWVTLHIAS